MTSSPYITLVGSCPSHCLLVRIRWFQAKYPIFTAKTRLQVDATCDHISGIAALQLFERTTFDNKEMEIYVNFDQYKTAETSLKNSGFRRKKQDSECLKSVIGNSFPFIDEIVKFQTFINPNSNRRIHLIGTKKSPVLAILNFHSSKHDQISIILLDSPSTPPPSLYNELCNQLCRIQLLSFLNILPQNFTFLWNKWRTNNVYHWKISRTWMVSGICLHRPWTDDERDRFRMQKKHALNWRCQLLGASWYYAKIHTVWRIYWMVCAISPRFHGNHRWRRSDSDRILLSNNVYKTTIM